MTRGVEIDEQSVLTAAAIFAAFTAPQDCDRCACRDDGYGDSRTGVPAPSLNRAARYRADAEYCASRNARSRRTDPIYETG